MSDSKVAEYLAENPRMIGVLFTMSLLLMEAGNVAANGADTIVGP